MKTILLFANLVKPKLGFCKYSNVSAPGRRNPGPSGPQSAFPLGFPLPHPGGANLLEFLDEDGNLALQQNNLLAAYRAEQMAIFFFLHRLERAQR